MDNATVASMQGTVGRTDAGSAPGIACQQNRLQVFVCFQQVIVEITVAAQTLQIAAGNDDCIHGQRWRPGKGSGYRELGAIIGLHFPHS